MGSEMCIRDRDPEVLLSALGAAGVKDQDVVVLSDAEGVRVIPVRR